MRKEDALVRFWRQVEKTRTCWLWKGWTGKRRKGIIWVEGKPVYAHRFSYEQFIGSIPPDLYVCHHCDNPICVNPQHLFVGTQDDNMKDMKNKGRANRPKGESNGRAKLTEEDVLFIRQNYKSRHKKYSQAALAKRYGVSVIQIQTILYRKQWTHI